MSVSLYICEIPHTVNKSDLEQIFGEMEGYKECRMKAMNDKRKIAFVDFDSEREAKFALETLQGFRFQEDDKGIYIKFSDNTKGGGTQGSNKREERHPNERLLNNKSARDESESVRSDSIDNRRKPNNRSNFTDKNGAEIPWTKHQRSRKRKRVRPLFR